MPYYILLMYLYSVFNVLSGGDEENRTPDPLLAKQVLSQLSYTPIIVWDLLSCILKIEQCSQTESSDLRDREDFSCGIL